MSSEWKTSKLLDLLAIKPRNGLYKAKEFQGSGHRWLKMKDIFGNNFIRNQKMELITVTNDEIEKFGCAKGDLLFGRTSLTLEGVGDCALVEEIDDIPIFESNLFRLRFDIKKADPKFFFYYFKSSLGKDAIQSIAKQTAATSITASDLVELYFPIPRRNLQSEIAQFLGSLDDRIGLLRETNATLEAIAQALFKSWFVDFDPVHANAGTQALSLPAEIQALFPSRLVESPEGLIPDGWECTKLGDICAKHGGKIQTGPFGSQLHASDYEKSGTPVVMPKDILGRRVDAANSARVNEENVERLSKHKLQKGDIVFSRRGDVEKHALIQDAERGWLCGTGCLLVRAGASWLSPGYLSRSLDQNKTKEWLTRHAVGATMPNLNTAILAAVPILFPNYEVISAFESLINSVEKAISENIARANIIANIRETLLPRLISGQLRLSEAEAVLAEVG